MKNMKINLGINSSQITKAKDLANAIRRLNTSASQLKKIHIGSIGIKSSDVSKVRSLAQAMAALHKSGQAGANLAKLAVPQVNMGAIQRIRTATQVLTSYLAVLRAIQRMGNVRTPNVGGGGAGRPPPGGGGGGGVTGGGGLFGRVNAGMVGSFVAFTALTKAAQLAAASLTALAEAGYRRERGSLALAIGATPIQEAIIKAGSGAGPPGQTIVLDETTRREFTRSLLGDVQGDERGTAVAAVNIARAVEPLVQRLFAVQPGRGKDEILENLRQVVKAVNLGSQQLTDAQGNLTKDAGRVLNAISDAMVIDPELTPQLVNTTMRGLKTSAFSVDQEQLTRVLVNAGARGTRAGNEFLQAVKGLEGIQKKEANDQLQRIGVMKEGTAVQPDLLETNTAEWVRTVLAPALRKDMGMAAAAPGEEMKGFVPGALTRELQTLLGRQTSIQGVTDIILGDTQMQNTLAQIARLAGVEPNAAAQANWAAQLDRSGVALENAAARLMEAADKLIGFAGILERFNAGLEGKSRPWTLGDLIGIAPNPNAPKTRPWTLGDLMSVFGIGAQAAGGTAAGPTEAASVQVRQAFREREAARALVEQRDRELTQLRRQEAFGGQFAPRIAAGEGPTTGDAINALRIANEQLTASEIRLANARAASASILTATTVPIFNAVRPTGPILPQRGRVRVAQELLDLEKQRARAKRAELLSFQRGHGLEPTGVRDRGTREAARKQFAEMQAILGGAEGVKKLQTGLKIKADGLYGPITEFAVKVRTLINHIPPISPDAARRAITAPTIAPTVIDPIVKAVRAVTIPAGQIPDVITVRAVQVLTTRPATAAGLGGFVPGGAPQPAGFTPVAGGLMDGISRLTTASTDMEAAFSTGSTALTAAAAAAGSEITASVATAGGSITSAFASGGASAAALIRAALATGVNVSVRSAGGGGLDTGSGMGGAVTGGPR